VGTAFGPADEVRPPGGAGGAEATFSWSIVGMLTLGLVLAAAMVRWLAGA